MWQLLFFYFKFSLVFIIQVKYVHCRKISRKKKREEDEKKRQKPSTNIAPIIGNWVIVHIHTYI